MTALQWESKKGPREALTSGAMADTFLGGIDMTDSTPTTCSVGDCDSPQKTRDWCRKHYIRWLKYGDPTALRHRRQPTGDKPCRTCGEVKPQESYRVRVETRGPQSWRFRESQCGECEREIALESRRRRRNALREKTTTIKMASGCVDCGYNDHPEALEFDHLPGVEKVGAVAYMISNTWSWEKIEAEIAKCEVRCANCHAIVTAERR